MATALHRLALILPLLALLVGGLCSHSRASHTDSDSPRGDRRSRPASLSHPNVRACRAESYRHAGDLTNESRSACAEPERNAIPDTGCAAGRICASRPGSDCHHPAHIGANGHAGAHSATSSGANSYADAHGRGDSGANSYADGPPDSGANGYADAHHLADSGANSHTDSHHPANSEGCRYGHSFANSLARTHPSTHGHPASDANTSGCTVTYDNRDAYHDAPASANRYPGVERPGLADGDSLIVANPTHLSLAHGLTNRDARSS